MSKLWKALHFHWALFQGGYIPENFVLCFRCKSQRVEWKWWQALFKYEITVVGFVRIALQSYAHQKHCALWWSLQEMSVSAHSRLLITDMLSGKGSARVRIMMMTLMTVIIILQSPPSFLCGKHFVYIISFNFLSWQYKSENYDLGRLKNLTDIRQPLSVWGWIWTIRGESCDLIITLLLVIITLGELGFI